MKGFILLVCLTMTLFESVIVDVLTMGFMPTIPLKLLVMMGYPTVIFFFICMDVRLQLFNME